MKKIISVFLSVVCLIFLLCNFLTANAQEVQFGEIIQITASNGEDITEKLQTVFRQIEENKSDSVTKVVLPKDLTLYISSTCSVYSNTYLDLNGSTLTRANTDRRSMLRTGSATDVVSGYAYKNISIVNGTIDGAYKSVSNFVRFGHAQNILVDKVTFTRNWNSHCIEIGATDNLVISNCTFKDQKADKDILLGKSEPCEAIQLDPLYEEIFDNYNSYDRTPTKNVEIFNCTFQNLNRAIGSHNLLVGNFFSNINIHNNTFNNIKQQAVATLSWYSSKITDNKFINCSRGIIVQSIVSTYEGLYVQDNVTKIDKRNTDIVIKNNTIDISNTSSGAETDVLKRVGIQIYGSKTVPAKYGNRGNEYIINNVTVENNTITTDSSGIKLYGTVNSTVKNNTVTSTKANKENKAIYVADACDNITVHANKISNFNAGKNLVVTFGAKNTAITYNTINTKTSDNVIIVMEDSSASSIKNNKITSNGPGISIYKNSTCKEISNNTISSAKANGIAVFEKASVTNISSNNITAYDKGIYVGTSSSVTKISSNTLNNAKKGIAFLGSSKASEISYNKIKAKTDGIYLHSSTATKLYKNSISSFSGYGIMLYSKSKTSYIQSNTISGGNFGISVNTNANGGSIKYNTISGQKDSNIGISNKSTASLYGNKLSSAKKNGIYVYKATLSASKNTVSKAKYGIKGYSSKITVKSNTVNSSSAYGIYATTKSVLKLTSNTVNGAKYDGIYVSSGTLTMSSNKITKALGNGVTAINATVSSSKDKLYKNKNGMYIKGSSKLTSKSSSYYTNSQCGIRVEGSGKASVSGGKIYSNKYGIGYRKNGSVKISKISFSKNKRNTSKI